MSFEITKDHKINVIYRETLHPGLYQSGGMWIYFKCPFCGKVEDKPAYNGDLAPMVAGRHALHHKCFHIIGKTMLTKELADLSLKDTRILGSLVLFWLINTGLVDDDWETDEI